MAEKTTVVLGGVEHEVKPIDLGTLKAIGVGSARMQSAPPGADAAVKEAVWYEGTFEILSAAMKKPLEDVLKIEGATLNELLAANRKILMMTGLAVETKVATGKTGGVPKPGESEGAAAG